MWLFPSSYSRSSHSREDTFGTLAAFQLIIGPSHYFGFQGTGGKSNSTEHKKTKSPFFLSFAQSGHVGRRRETLRVADVDWRYLDVTLGAQVVDLRGLHLVDDLHQTRAVCQIAVVQLHVLTERQTDKQVFPQVSDQQRCFSHGQPAGNLLPSVCVWGFW